MRGQERTCRYCGESFRVAPALEAVAENRGIVIILDGIVQRSGTLHLVLFTTGTLSLTGDIPGTEYGAKRGQPTQRIESPLVETAGIELV